MTPSGPKGFVSKSRRGFISSVSPKRRLPLPTTTGKTIKRYFLARVSRAARVVLDTRNARAMSPVSRPQIRRRVSATWASRESAGWQQVKIRPEVLARTY
jgi:hypothetical protein